jgi:putative phosphoesterase
MVIAIIADTHMPRGSRALPAGCVERLLAADAIVHAGDLTGLEALGEVEALALADGRERPLIAVHGNVDAAEVVARLPGRVEAELGGVRLGVVHDAGQRRGRLERMRREFPEADAVVFGHSHMPLHEHEGAFQIFNPGSPTERRRAPSRSMGMALVEASRIEFEHVYFD